MIRVVDIETTGMEPGEGAEIIEIGWWDMHKPSEDASLRRVSHGQRFYSPERPCPPEVRAVHHIHPTEYAQAPRFCHSIWHEELRCAGIMYCCAHNAEYEQKFLTVPSGITWLCTYKSALRVWPHAPHHGNQSLMYWLGLDTELLEDQRHPPHRALPDAYVTAAILGRMLAETTVEQIAQWTLEPRLLPRCPIGKEWRDKPWSEVDSGFLHWMLRQPDMEADYRWNAQREIDRRRTERHLGN